jgi:hypothetical protein
MANFNKYRAGISLGAGANITMSGSASTANFASGTGAADGATTTVILPHSTAVGTGSITSNGLFKVGQRAAGSPCLITRLNGTTYYAALTAA